MEILSDATFKGNVTFNKNATFNDDVIIDGGDFSVTRAMSSDKSLAIDSSGLTTYGTFTLHGNLNMSDGCVRNANIPKLSVTEFQTSKNGSIGYDLRVGFCSTVGSITLNGSTISRWDQLKQYQCQILRFRNPIIPASCNTFYFISPGGSNAIIHNSGISGSVSEFFITQVYSARGDNWGRVVQMETGLKWCQDNNTFALYGSIANHNEEIPETSYIAVVNI